MARKKKFDLPGSVVAAVTHDLEAIFARDPDLAASGLAASAVALARKIDDPKNSATSVSMCARALAETMQKLRDLAPAAAEPDQLDEMAAARTRRLAG